MGQGLIAIVRNEVCFWSVFYFVSVVSFRIYKLCNKHNTHSVVEN